MVTQMVLGNWGFYPTMDDQPLHISGLLAGIYQLKINDQVVGEFTADQLGDGVNLAAYRTPMLEQSYRVLHRVWQQLEWRYFTWREIQLKLSDEEDPAVRCATENLIFALRNQSDCMAEQQYTDAIPLPTHYELKLVGNKEHRTHD